jgi:hypothetical protein
MVRPIQAPPRRARGRRVGHGPCSYAVTATAALSVHAIATAGASATGGASVGSNAAGNACAGQAKATVDSAFQKGNTDSWSTLRQARIEGPHGTT